jgi:hypothetical protein
MAIMLTNKRKGCATDSWQGDEFHREGSRSWMWHQSETRVGDATICTWLAVFMQSFCPTHFQACVFAKSASAIAISRRQDIAA